LNARIRIIADGVTAGMMLVGNAAYDVLFNEHAAAQASV
jgi:hypothetical protein